MNLVEQIIKAEHGMAFVCDDLQQALRKSSLVITIVLLDLCKQANQLTDAIKGLREAAELEAEE